MSSSSLSSSLSSSSPPSQFIECLPGTSLVSPYLILTSSQWDRFYYYPHFLTITGPAMDDVMFWIKESDSRAPGHLATIPLQPSSPFSLNNKHCLQSTESQHPGRRGLAFCLSSLHMNVDYWNSSVSGHISHYPFLGYVWDYFKAFSHIDQLLLFGMFIVA